MIIENKDYKRNKKGEITNHQVVLIQCDECDAQWSGLYVNRKKKKSKLDLCVNCRAKHRFDKGKVDRPSRTVKCDHCGKEFKRYAAMINKVNYCNTKCRDDAMMRKYSHLYGSIEQNFNEWSYLCGLILGDGHLNRVQKRTAKIDISFDTRQSGLIDAAENVLQKIGIEYSLEPKTHNHCQKINFSLPNDLLEKYDMLWSSDKYKAQPKPCERVVSNKCFVGGLINSDGCMYVEGKKETLRFTNTCLSIIESLKQSLDINNVNYSEYSYDPKPHPKTGNMQKRSYIIRISDWNNVCDLREQFYVRK